MNGVDVYGLTFGSILLISISISGGALIIFSGLRHAFPDVFQPQRYKQYTFNRFPWIIDVFFRPLEEFSRKGDLIFLYVLHQTAVIIMLFILSCFSVLVLIPVYWRGTVQGNFGSGWSSITISHLEGNCLAYIFPLIATFIYMFVILFYYTQLRSFCVRIQQNLPPPRYVLLLHLPKELRYIQSLQTACRELYGESTYWIIPVTQNFHMAVKCIKKQENLAHRANVQLCECEWHSCILQREMQMRVTNGVLLNRLINIRRIRAAKKFRRSKQTFSQLLHMLDKVQESLDIILLGQSIRVAQYQRRMEKIKYPDFSDYQCLRALGSDLSRDIVKDMSIKNNYHERSSEDNINLTQWFKDLKVVSAVLEFPSPSIAHRASQIPFSSNVFKPRVLTVTPQHVLWSNIQISEIFRAALQVLYILLVLVYLTTYFFPSTTLINLVNKHSPAWFQQIYAGMCSPQRNACKIQPSISGETKNTIGSITCYACYKVANYMIVFLPTIITMCLNSLLPVVIGKLAQICRPVFITSLRTIEYQTIFWFLIIIQGALQIVLPSLLSSAGVLDYSPLLTYSLNQILSQIGRNMPNQVFSFLTYVCTKYFMFSILSLFRPMDILMNIFNTIMYQRSYWPIRSYRAAARFNIAKLCAYSSHMLCIGFLFGIIAPVSIPVVTVVYTLMAAVDRHNILYVHPVDDENWLSPAPNILFFLQNTIFIGFAFMLVATGAYYLLLSGWVRIVCFSANILFLAISTFVKKTHDRKYKLNPKHSGIWREVGAEKKSIFRVSDNIWKEACCQKSTEWGQVDKFHMYREEERQLAILDSSNGAVALKVEKPSGNYFERLACYTRIPSMSGEANTVSE